ncbi:MAG: carbon-nitrogen hydrolase family protein [Cephaloticoccus sp.]|nr:carbon-nitrogen hydrolase family protein [Cephaloticoccus sp.]MCF7759986.1 carbon-nitrogen hydrolase family protein [Cephaloticoccus sp.]
MAQAEGVDLLCFPECFLQGYLTDAGPARRHAIDLRTARFQAILARLAPISPTLVVGLIEADRGKLYNTTVVISHGHLAGSYRKTHLLTSERIFTAGDSYPIFANKGLKFGINICYDTNFPEASAALANLGATVILCPANNMLPRDVAEQWKHRHNAVRCQRVKETGLWLISADVTGERADSISYGPTAAINPYGQVVAQVPLNEVGMIAVDVPIGFAPTR